MLSDRAPEIDHVAQRQLRRVFLNLDARWDDQNVSAFCRASTEPALPDSYDGDMTSIRDLKSAACFDADRDGC